MDDGRQRMVVVSSIVPHQDVQHPVFVIQHPLSISLRVIRFLPVQSVLARFSKFCKFRFEVWK